MSAESGSDRWSLAAQPEQFLIHEFDDGAMLFDRRDGQTHFVNPVAVATLNVLSHAPLPVDDLVAQLENRFAAELAPEERVQVHRMLAQLRALKLVRCSSDSTI